MASRKRARDNEYEYDPEPPLQVQTVSVDNPPAPFPQNTTLQCPLPRLWTTDFNTYAGGFIGIDKDYQIAQILDQARAAGFLKDTATSGTQSALNLSRPRSSSPVESRLEKQTSGLGKKKRRKNLTLSAAVISNDTPLEPGDALIPFKNIPKPDSYPPPLPTIEDKTLERQIFTHISSVHNPNETTSDTPIQHNERLEFYGDSYMNYCVTKIIYNRFPYLREGELTRFRSQLISNGNIYNYAQMYGFPERLLVAPSSEKDDIREKVKKVADTFEAYVGGILTDNPFSGESIVLRWMADITKPQVDEIAKTLSNRGPVNKNAKQELYVLLDAKRAKAAVYEVTREGASNHDFEVRCVAQGREIGRGTGRNKTEAGNRAAMEALKKIRRGEIVVLEEPERMRPKGGGRQSASMKKTT